MLVWYHLCRQPRIMTRCDRLVGLTNRLQIRCQPRHSLPWEHLQCAKHRGSLHGPKRHISQKSGREPAFQAGRSSKSKSEKFLSSLTVSVLASADHTHTTTRTPGRATRYKKLRHGRTRESVALWMQAGLLLARADHVCCAG